MDQKISTQPIRQGDVLLVPVASMPNTTRAVPRVDGRIVLALGEATGHAHVIEAEDAELFETADSVDRYLRLRSATVLKHIDASGALTVDHAPVAVEPRVYQVVIQREWTAEKWRPVID